MLRVFPVKRLFAGIGNCDSRAFGEGRREQKKVKTDN